MAMAKRALAVYVVGSGLAAAALLMVTGLIHDGSTDYPIWRIMNWFMVFGVVIMLALSFRRWRGQDAGGGQGDLGTSLVFYAAIALTMLFFWEWFWTLNPDSETGDAVTSHLIYFPLVDAIYTVVGLDTGRYLWRCASG